MAAAKKCDRCGTLYVGYNTDNNSKKTNGFMLLNIDDNSRYYSHKVNDLCPDCMKSFRKWFTQWLNNS